MNFEKIKLFQTNWPKTKLQKCEVTSPCYLDMNLIIRFDNIAPDIEIPAKFELFGAPPSIEVLSRS